MQTLLLQRMGQGAHHVVLPHHVLKAAGAVLAGQDDVTHGGDSTGARSRLTDNRAP